MLNQQFDNLKEQSDSKQMFLRNQLRLTKAECDYELNNFKHTGSSMIASSNNLA